MKKYLAVLVLYCLFIFTLAVDYLYSLGIVPFHCFFKTITGYPCPFCGGIRAIVSMVTLHPLEAAKWNPLAACLFLIVVFSFPLAIVYLPVSSLWSRSRSKTEDSDQLMKHNSSFSSRKSFIASAFNNSLFRKSLIVAICILTIINWLWLIFWSPYSY